MVAKFGPNASGIPFSWRANSIKVSIPWVRCASGNVLLFLKAFHLAGLEINQQKNVKMGSVSNVTLVGSWRCTHWNSNSKFLKSALYRFWYFILIFIGPICTLHGVRSMLCQYFKKCQYINYQSQLFHHKISPKSTQNGQEIEYCTQNVHIDWDIF